MDYIGKKQLRAFVNRTSPIRITVKHLLVFLFVLAAVGWAWFLAVPGSHIRLTSLFNDTEYLGRDGVVLQTTRNNCGPSALKMVLSSRGTNVPLQELESGIPLTEDGASMLALKDAAERYGVDAEGWKLAFDDLRTGPLPALAFVDRSHFVVVDSIVRHTVYLRDPGVGRLAVPEARFKERWSGETLIFRH